MNGYPARKFNLIDAIIIIAACALGMAGHRVIQPAIDEWLTPVDRGSTPRNMIIGSSIHRGLAATMPYLSASTIAACALRLRRSRPEGQPGTVACLVAMFTLVVSGVMYVLLTRDLSSPRVVHFFFATVLDRVAFAIAGAWTVLFLAGRTQPDRSWTERACLVIGPLWILAFGLEWLVSVVIRWS